MKRCPECRRDYYDETLLYCLEDGTALVQGSVPSPDEPATAILHETAQPGESVTRAQIHTTDQTAAFPSGVAPVRERGLDKRLFAIPLLLAIVIFGGIYGIYKYSPVVGQNTKELSLADAKITRLTTSGKASSVAISPDGKYVVHVQDDGGQQSLYMRQVATQSNVQIVAPSTRRLGPLHFSPDGNYIYYCVFGQEFTRKALFQVPTLGGAPKQIVENLTGHISFSPDGRRLVFARTVTETESALIIVNADGTNEEKLIGSNATERFDNVAWSPDGQKIVYQVAENRPDSPGSTLFEVQIADRSIRPLTIQKWLGMQGLIWMSDGSRLLMLAGSQRAVYQIFEISYPGGAVRRLTNDLDSYTALGLTADSATLAAVKRVSEANIWIAPTGAESRARLLTPGSGKVDDYPSWSHDGRRIVFSSQTGANIEIWSVNEDGTDLRQVISNEESNFHPSVSPDGRSIAFVSSRNGLHIWRTNIDGSDARQLTSSESSQYAPTFSKAGRTDQRAGRLAVGTKCGNAKIQFRRDRLGIGHEKFALVS